VWLDPTQTRLTSAPVHSPGTRTYSYQNQDVFRSGFRPTAPRPDYNSVGAASAISWRPTPPEPAGQPKKLIVSFSSSVAPSGADSVCRSSTADCGKTRSAAYRCSQTPPLTSELPRGCVAWGLTTCFLRSSSYFNTRHVSPNRCVGQTLTFEHTVQRLIEKGIDLKLGLDLVRYATSQSYDVAIVFSQDGDLVEAVEEVHRISKEQNRWVQVECAHPYTPVGNCYPINRTVMRQITRVIYDASIDPTDYRIGVP